MSFRVEHVFRSLRNTETGTVPSHTTAGLQEGYAKITIFAGFCHFFVDGFCSFFFWFFCGVLVLQIFCRWILKLFCGRFCFISGLWLQLVVDGLCRFSYRS